MPRVHPRACGGSSRLPSRCRSNSGPSPRVRAKLILRRVRRRCRGSIPARAGEAVTGLAAFGLGGGPSPRVRAKRCGGRMRCASVGSIPARAGEASPCLRGGSHPQVHPRACGGSPAASEVAGAVGGPSPRVRGKPTNTMAATIARGSIPARAGEARCRRCRPWPGGVHPRACGGSLGYKWSKAKDRGPSPRVRGKRDHAILGNRPLGSIPARAGEASPPVPGTCVPGVHPRACGGSA